MSLREKKTKPNKKSRSSRFVKTKTVFQMEPIECGAASLAMIMGTYGVNIPLEELRIETGVSRNGSNAKNVCTASEKYGFKADGYRRSADRLIEKGKFPCICHWDFVHFLVVEGYKKGKFYINCPMKGRYSISKEEFEKHFTGVELEILPNPEKKLAKRRRSHTLLAYMKDRLRLDKITLLSLLLIGILLILPGILSPIFSQLFFDEILINDRRNWFKWILFSIILAILFDGYFTLFRDFVKSKLQAKLTVVSSDRMIEHMLRLPMMFYEQRNTGDLCERVSNNAKVNSFITGEMLSLIINILTSAVYFVVMLVYNAELSLVVLAFVVLSIAITIFSMNKIDDAVVKYGQDKGQYLGYVFSGMRISSSLKAVGAENDYVSKLLGYAALMQRSDQKIGRLQQSLDAIPNTISMASKVVILMIGGLAAVKGYMTPGMLISYTAFCSSFSTPFTEIVNFARNMKQTKNDLNRVSDLMGNAEDNVFIGERVVNDGNEKLAGNIELNKIAFRYGKLDKSLVKNLSLKLEPGKSVAFVGASGSGKSTVAKIITGLYEPDDGELLYDGISYKDLPRNVLVNSISTVSQRISLFDGSIRNNITMWDATIPKDTYEQAAKDACIHDEIMAKSNGYGFELANNGSNISGGQAQRIEIAKALVKNPSILVMDEATSSLDSVTEEKILNNIKKRNITTIVVAQRLSTIRNCDEIIVLRNGRVVERGTHDELMELKGRYFEYVQTGEY